MYCNGGFSKNDTHDKYRMLIHGRRHEDNQAPESKSDNRDERDNSLEHADTKRGKFNLITNRRQHRRRLLQNQHSNKNHRERNNP